MKRWPLFLVLVIVLISASTFIFTRLINHPAQSAPQANLTRMPLSAYHYQLCTEAYAFAFAAPDNPYKTDYTFKDPFRRVDDMIVPHLLGYDTRTGTVNFAVDMIVPQVKTFHKTIANVHEQDGIAIQIPDTQNRLQHTSVPQFIVSHFGKGMVAILDYTCPDQWIWKPN